MKFSKPSGSHGRDVSIFLGREMKVVPGFLDYALKVVHFPDYELCFFRFTRFRMIIGKYRIGLEKFRLNLHSMGNFFLFSRLRNLTVSENEAILSPGI